MKKHVVHKDSWLSRNGHLCGLWKSEVTKKSGPCCSVRWSSVTCKRCLRMRRKTMKINLVHKLGFGGKSLCRQMSSAYTDDATDYWAQVTCEGCLRMRGEDKRQAHKCPLCHDGQQKYWDVQGDPSSVPEEDLKVKTEICRYCEGTGAIWIEPVRAKEK